MFVINYIPYEMKNAVIICSTRSGRNIDKFKEAKLEKEEAEKINCCRLKDALAFVECKVVNEAEAGYHIIFIGKVVSIRFKKKGKRLFQLEKLEFTTTKEGI